MAKPRQAKTECPFCHTPMADIVCAKCGCAAREGAPVETREISPRHAATEIWAAHHAVILPLGSARVCGHHKAAL
jgi:hypothetical protein